LPEEGPVVSRVATVPAHQGDLSGQRQFPPVGRASFSLGSAFLLPLEVSAPSVQGSFLWRRWPTAAAAPGFLSIAWSAGGGRAVSTASLQLIARRWAGGSSGQALRPPVFCPSSSLLRLLHRAAFAGFPGLRLTNSSVTRQDVVVQWGFCWTTPLTFAYPSPVVVAFRDLPRTPWHAFVFDRRYAGRGMGRAKSSHRRWRPACLSAVLIASSPIAGSALPPCRDVIPSDSGAA